MRITRTKLQLAINTCIRDLFAMHDDASNSDKQIIVALANDSKVRVTRVCDKELAFTVAVHLLKELLNNGEISKTDLIANILAYIDEA